MKTIFTCTAVAFILFFTARNLFAQTSAPVYDLKFQLRKANGALTDTVLQPFTFQFWTNLPTPHPNYVKWKNLPFALSIINGKGVVLLTDSTHSYAAGDTIGYLFYNIGSAGSFKLDYQKSNIGYFINDDPNPDLHIVAVSNGLIAIASRNIGPNTKLNASYKNLLVLFPNDLTVQSLVKYH